MLMTTTVKSDLRSMYNRMHQAIEYLSKETYSPNINKAMMELGKSINVLIKIGKEKNREN